MCCLLSHPTLLLRSTRHKSEGTSHKERRPTRRERECVMKLKRRAIVLLTTMAVVLVVGSGMALAATTINCPNDPSQGSPSTYLYCNGTSFADTMYGSDQADYMLGKGANDTMHGYAGGDTLEGDNGPDHI